MDRATLAPFMENTVPVRQFADRIKSELAQSTTAWWTIAKIFGEADKQYGFSSKPMRELIQETNISASSPYS
ncbi:hypothetical protein [Asticcacaulis taihuensis]|uniref:hypothetical protein n=1 Tax=Asticcacaulis taihuensis TaxID=260084 RepID=UPI0026EC76C7|nr:hypothetical protein [Asticcacaulis taihuensis]